MRLLQQVIRDPALLRTFGSGGTLPPKFGYGIDERIVEYPWVLSRLDSSPGRLLDAGSTLNQHYLLDTPQLSTKIVIITTLAPEWRLSRPGIFYTYGDLRRSHFRDGSFATIVCISTLEHIGLDNTAHYTNDDRFREASPTGYRAALRELRRLLAPGGRLLLTVPFGKAADLGWMQQFDAAGIEAIRSEFGPSEFRAQYFHYSSDGWQTADAAQCADCEYYDVHARKTPAEDRAAAARSVACLQFRPALEPAG